MDEALKTLASWDASVRAVVAEETLASGPPLLNLLPIAKGQAPSVFLHGVNPWLAALVVVLALAAMAAPALIKRQAVVQLLPWLDKGRTAAEAADTLRGAGKKIRGVVGDFWIERDAAKISTAIVPASDFKLTNQQPTTEHKSDLDDRPPAADKNGSPTRNN